MSYLQLSFAAEGHPGLNRLDRRREPITCPCSVTTTHRVTLTSVYTLGRTAPVSTMDFTQAYKQTNFLVEFSKGAQWILTAVGDRLIVRRADSFLIERTWLVESAPITHIGWSWDSEYVFGANSRQGVVNVFKITDETWNARVVAGAEGLARVEWAPDGRSILCFSEWGVGQRILLPCPYRIQRLQLRVTIWSLTTGSATYIQFPIHPDKGEPAPSSSFPSLMSREVIVIAPMGSTLFWPSATSPRTRSACMIPRGHTG